jgi:membrane-bound metal-dependent hydrolase YbcI (DUF457 family)
MFATGHIALGYILGESTARITKTHYNICILLTLTILPDIDFAIPGITHRGPTHSIFVIILLFLPFLIAYRKTAIPYIVATGQHLIGDYIAGGGIQLLWPLNQNWYGLNIPLSNPITITLELILFLGCIALMIKTKDLQKLLKPHPSNLILIIPAGSIFSPVFLNYPLTVPNELIIPHLIFLAIFSLSIIIEIKNLIHSAHNLRHKQQ